MKITDSEQGSSQVISVNGRLDASTAPQLQSHFEELVANGKRLIVLDLQGADYVSSGGLRVLLIMTRKIRTVGGGIVLANLHPFVEDLLTMAGFNKLIPTAATTLEAINLLAKGETA